MPTMPASGTLVGLEYIQVWRAGLNSRAYGQSDPDGVLPDVMVPMLLRNPRSVQFPAINRTVVNLTGGNRWRGSVMFGVGAVDSFPLVLSDMNNALSALVTGAKYDRESNDEFGMISDNIDLTQLPVCGMAATSLFHSSDDGSDGDPYWITAVFPKIQITPPPAAAASYQEASDITYQVLPNRASYLPNGRSLATTSMTLANNKAMCIVFITQYPWMMASFIGDNTQDAWDLPFKPKSTAVGTATSTKNWFHKNGVAEALSAMSANGELETAAALATGAYGNIMYQVDPSLPLAS